MKKTKKLSQKYCTLLEKQRKLQKQRQPKMQKDLKMKTTAKIDITREITLQNQISVCRSELSFIMSLVCCGNMHYFLWLKNVFWTPFFYPHIFFGPRNYYLPIHVFYQEIFWDPHFFNQKYYLEPKFNLISISCGTSSQACCKSSMATTTTTSTPKSTYRECAKNLELGR